MGTFFIKIFLYLTIFIISTPKGIYSMITMYRHMSHTSLPRDPEEIWELYNKLDELESGAIDTNADLESGNWGCPIRGSEKIREILTRLYTQSKPLLETLKELAEYMEARTERDTKNYTKDLEAAYEESRYQWHLIGRIF